MLPIGGIWISNGTLAEVNKMKKYVRVVGAVIENENGKILAALRSPREGVKYFEDLKTDIFFITLNKSDKDFSPSTQYEDYAINDRLFHWQSQSRTSDTSPTGKRYINHRQTGNHIALFVREYKKDSGYTAPFTFLGITDYVSHTGSQPISFVWRLHEKMPAKMVQAANKNVL